MKTPISKIKKKVVPARIFSGEASRGMWKDINNAKTIHDLKWALYGIGCKLQEFEIRLEKEGK